MRNSQQMNMNNRSFKGEMIDKPFIKKPDELDQDKEWPTEPER